MSLSISHQLQSRNDVARPSSLIIAFAIAVVRSKPLELSIGEYVRLLREHVARGRRRDTVSATYRHLDRSSYWRSRYEQTNDALKRAQDEVVGLRLEIETLKNKRDTARPSTATKKRKKPDEDVIPYPRSPKRSNREASPVKSGPAANAASLDSPTHAEFYKAGEIGNTLLRNVYHVNMILKRRDKSDLSNLSYHVICAASTVPQIVEQEVQKFASKDASDLVSLGNTLTAAGRSIKLVLLAFTRLANISESVHVQGKVTYGIVGMFKNLINGISQLSQFEMNRAISAEAALNSRERGSTAKPKSKPKAPKAVTVQEIAVLGTYTAFLTRLIEMLDHKKEAHKPLFEGMAYCIIDKLGKRLFCTVFGHDRGANLDAEILQHHSEDGMVDEGPTATPSPSDPALKQAKLEAPYLIHLLKSIMVAAPSHLGLAVNNKTGKPKQVSGKGAAKATLAIAAKECLQRTLVNSIFGTEGTNEDDPFIDCLKMPIVGDGAFTMPRVKETDTQEWFKEEIWRLLGWDILERELDRSSSG